MARIQIGNPAKSVLMVGLRGVGKTVLLDKIRQDADAAGMQTIRVEAPEERSLPAMLAPQLRLALLRLSRVDHARAAAERGLKALSGFVQALKIKFGDIEVGLDFDPEPGLADNGDFGRRSYGLTRTSWQCSQERKYHFGYIYRRTTVCCTGSVRCAHHCPPSLFSILPTANRRRSGLAATCGLAGKAKSYAERLFDYPTIGPLSADDAALAIIKPAREQMVEFTNEAVTAIIEKTHGYPLLLARVG